LRDPRLIEFAKQMRREMTEPEKRLWFELRAGRFHGVKFRRQKVIGHYIADFASNDPRLVVELDGDTHGFQQVYDAVRSAFLGQQGYKVIRFLNSEILQNMDGVLERLRLEVAEIPPLPGASRLSLSPEGERGL
jgi:very-short-patch-repair endonuclease